ncbi:MAG: shikimate kinase [Bacteroidales bacterium]|nr:shikimate kinase [Bacteroidales bacterium]
MKIFLIGFMGSGKSTYGKELANLLQFTFFDLDTMIEEKTKKSISEIFEQESEQQFRHYETHYLHYIVENFDNLVVATGGGTPCFNDNMKTMINNGITVYLQLSSNVICERIKHTTLQRPLLKNINPDELVGWINTTLNDREYYYSQAHITINPSRVSPKLLRSIIMSANYCK